MSEENKEYLSITGTVLEIIYTNEDNGYTVCEIDSKSEGQFTATGYMPYISEGESIELYGNWKTHPEYGDQLNVKSYKSVLPSDVKAILLYLSSGIIPGIREATAKRIVDEFGKDTFDVMINSPEKLSSVKGISKQRAVKIGEEFQQLQSMSGIVMFLQQFNISAKAAAAVHKAFGTNAVEKIKENPYILADNIDSITFKTSDNIASLLGFSKNFPKRISSFVKYTLTDAAYRGGHSYLPEDILVEHVTYNLGVTRDEVLGAIGDLSLNKDVFSDTVDEQKVYYLMSLLTAELYIARRIYSLSSNEPKYTMNIDDAWNTIDEICATQGIVLADEQKNAILSSITNSCVIITGGPGTGKTTTINTIIKLMQEMNLKIALAAPTGRAAKRMSEITSLEAKTIHRLLGVTKNANELFLSFSRNEENPLPDDVVIVDEMSMLDINLMSSLLKAIKPGARLIMVGDCDQLPSVGPGNVLNDLIESKTIPVIKLNHIFRQAQESMIVVNAHRINNGEIPIFKNDDSDFFFLKRDNSQSLMETVASLYKTRLPERYKINPVNSIQVLSPSRKGPLGVIALNNLLQQNINPPDYMKNEHAYGKTIFRVGDKVMQNKNNYDIPWIRDNGEEGIGIFNGDIGIISKISTIDKQLEIIFDDDKLVEYSFNNLDELELAYAITVHKSQGNEFNFVIIPVTSFAPMLMFRNLLYTAITRAKQMVILVGDEANILKMINNDKKTKRYSGLLEKIRLIKNIYEKSNDII